MDEKPAESRTEGRLVEKALTLTIATLVLLMPPILTIFDVPLTIGGFPLLIVYCFVVWLAAIVLGGWLARRMDLPSITADHSLPGEPDKG